MFLPDGSPRFQIRQLYNLRLAKEAFESQSRMHENHAVREELQVRQITLENPTKTQRRVFRLNFAAEHARSVEDSSGAACW